MFFAVFAAFLILVVAALSGCTPPYRQTFEDEGAAKGWTQKQTDAAFAYADRIFWSHEAGENKYVISYGKIPTAKVRQQLQGSLADLDAGLDPKNSELSQYLATFNLRKDMEHDEEIAQAIYDRVHAAELQTEFKQRMGDISEYGPEAEVAQGYSVRRIYVNKPLVDAFPFTSDVIDNAKKSGTLKKVASLTLDESNQFDHKEPNPKNRDDKNDFIWKARQQAIALTEYKIIDVDKPLDNKGDYIEGYRVVDGKQEQYPAIKVFFPSSGSMAILLVDCDESGMPGFGVPDIIEAVSGATNLQDLLRNQSLLNSLFEKKQGHKDRTVQEAQLFKIEIAPIGAKIDEWQKASDVNGWIVPFKYTSITGDNYNVRIKYKKLHLDVSDPASMIAAHDKYFEIEYIEKEFTKSGEQYEPSAGRVLEYYRPKGVYAGKVRAEVDYTEDTKKVTFEFPDGTITDGKITAGSNKFLEDKPFAKSYNEGGKRWWIESLNNDGKYDMRKQVGQPKEDTGFYSSDSPEEQVLHAYGAKAGPDDNPIKEAIKAHDELWAKFQLNDEVEGVGVGEKDGKQVIFVYVNDKIANISAWTLQHVPATIHGFPVIVERSGPFRPLNK